MSIIIIISHARFPWNRNTVFHRKFGALMRMRIPSYACENESECAACTHNGRHLCVSYNIFK